MIELHSQKVPLVEVAISSIGHLRRRIHIRRKVVVCALERILDLLNLFRVLRPFFTITKVESQVGFLLHLIHVVLVGSWILTGFCAIWSCPNTKRCQRRTLQIRQIAAYRQISRFSGGGPECVHKFFDPGIPLDVQETNSLRCRPFLTLS